MSAIDYNQLSVDVQKLLKSSGQPLVLRRVTSGSPAHDPATGANNKIAITNLNTVGILIKPSWGYVQTHQVLSSDSIALVAGSPVPQMTDQLVVGGDVVMTIINIEAVNPAGIPVAFKIQVRR